MHKPHCLHITETPVSLKCPNFSAIPRVSWPLIISENAVCKLPHRILSPGDCAHKNSHEIQRTGLFVPLCPTLLAWQGQAGNAQWDITISCDYLLRKSMFYTLFLRALPSCTLRTTLQAEYSNSEFHEPWIQSWEKKEGRLICCPSNPDYLFKHKFNFLIKCWKKFLQQHDYSRKKVQGTNKLPPPAPSQSVLAQEKAMCINFSLTGLWIQPSGGKIIEPS